MVSLLFASWFLAGCVPLRAEDCTVLLEDGLSGISKNLLKLTRFFPFGTENWTLCALSPGCARSSREAGNHAGSNEGRAMRTAGTNCEDCSRPGGTVEFHVNIVLIIVK